MSEHTPGPWRVVDQSGADPSYDVGVPNPAYPDEITTLAEDVDTLADARLMAAAPELLAACEMALGRCVCPMDDCSSCRALRAAIGKAKGP